MKNYIVLSIENLKNLKFKPLTKNVSFFIICIKRENENEEIFKEEGSIEILKILGLIHNIEEYQKIQNHT